MTDFTQYNKSNTQGKTHELLCGIEDQFGFLPNMFSYMIESPVTVKAYLQLNQVARDCSLTKKEKHLAMLTVSVENQCNFCVTAHKSQAIKNGIDEQTIDALFKKNIINNEQDAALVSLVQALVRKKGFVDEIKIDQFIAVGYTKKQVFECILMITIKTLSTYANHITKPEVNPEMTDPTH